MLAMQLRQSVKLIVLAYVVCVLAEVAILVFWFASPSHPDVPLWAPLVVPAVAAIFVAIRHIQRRMVRIIVSGDRLRYEAGLFSKTTRTIELDKVQDVRVDQTIGQRVLNIGDISLETAGGSSRIVMPSIDRPQEAADHILNLARTARPDGDAGAPRRTP